MHPSDGQLWIRHQTRLKEAIAAGFWNPADGYPALEKMRKPDGARRYGKCPDCHQYGWLHDWQHLHRLLCGDCIDNALDEMNDAKDALAVAQQFDNDPKDWGHDESDFSDGMEVF